RLGPLLDHLVQRRPELSIHVLLWDFSILYALEREPLPAINLDWKTPPQVSIARQTAASPVTAVTWGYVLSDS
ncbi:MAG: hypothetical protein R3352_01550, partial [Salinisphaeraceae bacterium]|nr:hypothetical protein [Salinisphaeraceae bacterium]